MRLVRARLYCSDIYFRASGHRYGSGNCDGCYRCCSSKRKITLTEVNTGVSRTSETNNSGNYTFPDVAGGSYFVTVEAPGFRREVRQNISVAVNTSTRVDSQLQPGELSQQVEVTAAPPPLQTDRADTSVNLTVAQTANLPTGTIAIFGSGSNSGDLIS
jgi:Carboxypeptidase regulatory-like domain